MDDFPHVSAVVLFVSSSEQEMFGDRTKGSHDVSGPRPQSLRTGINLKRK